MADQMIDEERTRIATYIEENADQFVSGEKDLLPLLDKTDELYKLSLKSENVTASRVVRDSDLVKFQAKIVNQSLKSCKFSTRDFDARSFAIELRSRYCGNLSSLNDSTSSTAQKKLASLWDELGQHAVKVIKTTPPFTFINGTFEADPIEKVHKERKKTVKDKIGELSQPTQINVSQANKDKMLVQATRILTLFMKLNQRNQGRGLYFYEFVVDPTSFTRTIENIFCVSLLVKEGRISVTPDDDGHPCLRIITEEGKAGWSGPSQQCVVSITIQDWKNLIEKYDIKKALIPKAQTATRVNET